MPKSKDAFRTISEVADWLETPAHVLRFWESKFTQVKPVKRAGGRRYYRPADMQLLGGIKKLLHDDGLTIKGAQKLLREHGVSHVAALSQPLEEDLIEDGLVAEAAYEPDAQPDPVSEAPATVLTFPSRSSEPKAEPNAEPSVAVETATSEKPEVPVENPQVTTEDAPAEPSGTPDRAGDAPAFGSDALPAFMRRAPAQSTNELPEPPADIAQDEVAATASAQQDSAPKLTINPETRFEPVASEAEQSLEATDDVAEAPKADASPVFSRRDMNAAPSSDTVPSSDTAPISETVASPEVPKPAPIAVDVPSIAKVAPSLDSYTAASGVLAALPGARRLSPEIANDLSAKLSELRALRDRMQSH